MRRVRWILVLSLLAGCTAPRGPLTVTDPDPAVKIPAIKKAAREGDRGATAQLVEELDSDDPAVRFYAIEALAELTGQTFGYRYFDDELERKPALERWRAWLDGSQQSATKNASDGSP